MVASVARVGMVVSAVLLVPSVASMVHLKRQLRQVKGSLVVLVDPWQQLLLLLCPGYRAWSSAVVYRWWAGEPGFLALGVVQARMGTDGLAFGAPAACGRAVASIKHTQQTKPKRE